MTGEKGRVFLRGAALFAAVIFVLTGLIGAVYEGNISGATEVEVSETEVVSTGTGNGPQEAISFAEMGMTKFENMYNSVKIPGSFIDDDSNIANFVDMSDTDNCETEGLGVSKLYKSGSRFTSSIPISMGHSWKLNLDVSVGGIWEIGRNTISEVELIGKDKSKKFRFLMGSQSPDVVHYMEISGDGTNKRQDMDKKYYGLDGKTVTNNMSIIYDLHTKEFTFTVADKTLVADSGFSQNDLVTLCVGGWYSMYTNKTTPSFAESQATFKFKSFKYSDYYIKADNYISDYAGRKITGRVGNGHTISVHPKVYNNIPENTQRYSGTVGLDSETEAKNIVPLSGQNGSNISSQPLAFTHTAAPFQEVTFDAEIDTGGTAYTPGQKFRIPLAISDDYFGSTALSGLPAPWYNIKHESGDGLKDQLPLRLNLVRDTNRTLTDDLSQENTPTSASADYSHAIAGKAAKPNAHGWYNNDVTISFQSNPSEFNELNFSSASGNEKISADSIKYTAANGGSFTVRGMDDEGSPTATGETPENGNTYRVFGRKGTSKETEDLSAVTTETFRIDKTSPTLKIEDRDKFSDPRKLKAGDALSGVDYIKWKGPKDTEYTEKHIIAIETDPNAELGTKSPVAQKLPKLTDLGNYTFVAVDLAGNESEPLTITNNRPVISAEDVKVSFKDTIKNFYLLTAHKAGTKDKEDGDLNADRLDWEVRKKGADTVLDKGTGKAALNDFLPVGVYEVTFCLNGEGTDADGNKPDPEKVTVKLTITPEGPPDITLTEDPGAGNVDGTTTTRPDGSRHYAVEDEKTLIVDTEKPYSGGSLTDQEIKEEIEDYFNFKSKLPYPANGLEIDLKIYDDKGNDITGNPVNTTKNGSYTAVYVATDKSGCTTTLQLTYNIKENVVVTFHPGKGDYKDGSENRQIEIKVNKAPEEKDLPDGIDTNVLTPPADTCFIGWGTSQSAKTTVDPTAIKLNKDTTYYAIYGPDINNNNIPDSKEAIFIFKSGEPEHAAFKYADKTMVGILAPAGTAVTLPSGRIPELLFDRTDDTGYRLEGWKTDATGDDLLTTEQLCALGRNAGTKLTVTAMITTYPIEAPDKVKVTFFSSDPENAPLKGGEGQTLLLDAPKEGEPVYLNESQLPSVKLNEGCALEGWKLEKTGDQLMEDKKVTEEKLYPGETVACIAYVKKPVKETDKVITKEKPITKTVTKKVEKTKVVKEKTPVKEPDIKKTADFVFYSSRTKSGVIVSGDGTRKKIAAGTDGFAVIQVGQIPEVRTEKGNHFIGWTTSLTGDRLFTNEELSALKVSQGVTVNCTAVFKYNSTQLTDDERSAIKSGNTSSLATLQDEQVPLGSRPFSKIEKSSCVVHFIMLIWLVLLAGSCLFRLHRRRKTENYLRMSMEQAVEEFGSIEEYEDMANAQTTGAADYVFILGNVFLGGFMYTMGTCFLEIPALIVGGGMAVMYLILMKRLDHKLNNRIKEAAER